MSDHSRHSGQHSYQPAQVERERIQQRLGHPPGPQGPQGPQGPHGPHDHPGPPGRPALSQRDSSLDSQDGQTRQLNPWDKNFPPHELDQMKHHSVMNLAGDDRSSQGTFNARSKSHENFSNLSTPRGQQQQHPHHQQQQPGRHDNYGQVPQRDQQYPQQQQQQLNSNPGYSSRDQQFPAQQQQQQHQQQQHPHQYQPQQQQRQQNNYSQMPSRSKENRPPEDLNNSYRSQQSQQQQQQQQPHSGDNSLNRSTSSNFHTPQNGYSQLPRNSSSLPTNQQHPRGPSTAQSFPGQDRRSLASSTASGREGSASNPAPSHYKFPGSLPPQHRVPELSRSTNSTNLSAPPAQDASDSSRLHPDAAAVPGEPHDPHTYVNFQSSRGAAPKLDTSRDSSGGGPSPGRPPYPTEVRHQLVEEMAQGRPMKEEREMVEAAERNTRRMQREAYFQYPSPRESQPATSQPTTPSSQRRDLPNSRMSTASRTSQSSRKSQPQQPPPDMFDPEAQKLRVAYERVHSLRMGPANAPPKRKPAPIQTVKEDPNMSDRDILQTDLKKLQKKNPLAGPRLRMSISAGDLIGKTHDELVLLLIQLRRNQAALENTRDFHRRQTDMRKPAEMEHRRIMHQQGEVLDRGLHEQHMAFVEARAHMGEVDNKIEVYRPIISLLDNMVTMGSLYGGDNMMLATQYRRHLLRPDQYQPPKEMLEFTRQHQEDKLIQDTKDEIRQLSADEVDLEDKIDRLNQLDRLLQEQSFKAASFKQDKELMEKALTGVLRQMDTSSNDPREMRWLGQQQRTLGREISRVTQQLAEASKELEDTTAQNNKIEHEVALLRSKVHGELTRSRSAPSLASENVRTKMKMQQDLATVEGIMAGLKGEGQRLSHAMSTLRRSSSSGTLNVDSEESTKSPGGQGGGTYMQTDMDSGEATDLAGESRSSQGDNPGGVVGHVGHHQRQNAAEDWDVDTGDENTKRFFGLMPRDKPKGQTVRDVKRNAAQRKQSQKDDDDYGEEVKLRVSNVDNEVSSIIHARIPLPAGIKSVTAPTGNNNNNNNSHLDNGASGHPLYENLPGYSSVHPNLDPASAASSRRSSLILMAPKPFVPYQDVSAANRPFRSELALNTGNSAPLFSVPDYSRGDKNNSLDRSYRSEEVLNDRNNSSSGGLNGSKDGEELNPYVNENPYMRKAYERDNGPESQRSTFGQFHAKPYVAPLPPNGHDLGMTSDMTSEMMMTSQQAGGLYSTPPRSNVGSNSSAPHDGPSVMHPTLHNTAGDLILNRSIDEVPDIVKSSQTYEERMDEDMIDREILYVPDKVLIPERYDAEADAEELTEEEVMKREEKAEKIRRLLTSQSVLSMSQPDVNAPGAVHTRVQQERKEKDHYLALGQELARQVTLTSKKQAAERRKTWSGGQFADIKKQYDSDMAHAPGSPLRSPDSVSRRSDLTLHNMA